MESGGKEVKLLRWPSEARERQRCGELGVPRLLVLEDDAPAPVCVDALEDWIRPPVDSDDVRARAVALHARAMAEAAPELSLSGVLTFGGRRLALSPVEARLMAALIDSFGSLVTRETLIERGWPDDGAPGRNALDLQILRLRRRIAPLRLVVRTAWGRGYLLESEGATDLIASEGAGGD